MAKQKRNADRIPQRNFVRKDVVAEVDKVTQEHELTKQVVMEQGMQLWLKVFKAKGMVGVLEALGEQNA